MNGGKLGEFLKTFGRYEELKAKITKKSLLQLLYLNNILGPFADMMYKNKVFLESWLGNPSRLLAYVKYPVKNHDRSVTIHGQEILAMDVQREIEAASHVFSYLIDNIKKFYVDIKRFRNDSFYYMNHQGMYSSATDSKHLLDSFLSEYETLKGQLDAMDYLIGKLAKNISKHKAEYLSHDELLQLETMVKVASETFMNPGVWLEKTKKLRYDFYIKNRLLSNEFLIVRELASYEDLMREVLLNKSNYQDYLKDGDIIIGYKLYNYLNHDKFSKIISSYTKSGATHAGIYIAGKIAEARILYRKIVISDLYDRKNEILMVFRPRTRLDASQSEELNKAIVKYTGNGHDKPYSYNFRGLTGFVLAKRHSWLSPFLKSDKALFCSEFVDRCYRDIGISLTSYGDPSEVSPKDLIESSKLEFMYIIDGTGKDSPDIETSKDIENVLAQLRMLESTVIGNQY